MSKWLSVCIFLLLAIACTVDVEPTEMVAPAGAAAPIRRAEIDMPAMPAMPAELAIPGALAREERTNTSASPEATGDMARASVTRDWSHAFTP